MKEDAELESKLGAYLDGELSPEEAEKVRQLIQNSSEAERTVMDFQRIDEAVYAFDAPPVEETDWDRVAAGFRRELKRASARHARSGVLRLPRRGLLALAAAAALLVTGVLVVSVIQPGESPGASEYSENYDVKTREYPMGSDVDPEDVDGMLLIIEAHG